MFYFAFSSIYTEDSSGGSLLVVVPVAVTIKSESA